MNAARCDLCGDVLRSVHRHDFRGCGCGNLFVDGGEDYIRIGLRVPGSCTQLHTAEEYETALQNSTQIKSVED